MALVRREDVVGQQPQPSIPTQPHPGAPVPPPALIQAQAAAAGSGGANGLAVLGSFALAGLGAIGAFCVQRWGSNPVPLRLGNQTSVFALMFVFAAAVERLLEPFTQWLPGRKPKERLEQTVAAMANGNPAASIFDVAMAKAQVETAKGNRAILSWGLATGMATLVSSAGGFYVVRSLAESPDWSVIPKWMDALVTGLIVGSGTKPLHDWVARMQRTKDNAGDSPA
jgi:hypothetical protein